MTDDTTPSIAAEWLAQLFAGAPPRGDADQLRLAAPPQPSPMLIQGGAEVVTTALAIELVGLLARAGGTRLSPDVLGRLRDRLFERFTDTQRAHLEEELLRLLHWLEQHFDSARSHEPEDAERGFDAEPRKRMVEQALQRGSDLFVGFLDKDSVVQRFRVRPDGVEEHDAVWMLVGRRVPGGDELSLPLERLRWMLEAQRFHDLEIPEMATVHAFPGAWGGDG